MKTEDFYILGKACLCILLTVVPFLITLMIKLKKLIKNKEWSKILQILPNYIIQAEKFMNYSSEEKKEYVKSKLALYSIQNKITYQEEKVDEEIDAIVELTKKVNGREKDKNRIKELR